MIIFKINSVYFMWEEGYSFLCFCVFYVYYISIDVYWLLFVNQTRHAMCWFYWLGPASVSFIIVYMEESLIVSYVLKLWMENYFR